MLTIFNIGLHFFYIICIIIKIQIIHGAKFMKIIQGFIDRIDKSSNIAIVITGKTNDKTDEPDDEEISIPLSVFSETPVEGDSIPLYEDTKELVITNIGKTIYCEIEYFISGNETLISKKNLKEQCKLSGKYGNRADNVKLREVRKRFWKLCLREKQYLEEQYSSCDIFIKKVFYWTDKFENKANFTDFIRFIGYEKGQNSYLNDYNPDIVPNTF